jgi:type IV pilus assembly protein PilA
MKKGYSLIEIMIVIAVIGSLLMIAVPKYKNFIAKTRRTEAQVNLHSIYAAEQAFWAENGRYSSNLPEIGWHPEGKIKYSYGFVGSEGVNNFSGSLKSTAIPEYCQASQDAFVVCAVADIDGDGKFDILTINQNNDLQIVSDDILGN